MIDQRRSDPRTGLYSDELVSLLRDGGQRVVCVLNRKGRALLLDCAACGEVARCEHCAGAVRLMGEALTCRRCGRSRPQVCASCGSDALRSLRVGVTRAREQLEALAGRPVGEVTALTAGKEDLPGTDVFVGTEAVLYRESELRRRGAVGAVAFLDFDQELLAPRTGRPRRRWRCWPEPRAWWGAGAETGGCWSRRAPPRPPSHRGGRPGRPAEAVGG